MAIKKIARPVNEAKNKFIQWLKYNKAESIDEYEGKESSEWDYYRVISAFIGNDLYIVYFMVWNGKIEIDYHDEENNYKKLTVIDFLQLID